MKVILLILPVAIFTGCMNMPTEPAEITGSYVSPLKYENHSCKELAIETEALANRENQLTAAQNQRIKTSKTQAFWYGYGQGDSVAASELASVKGKKTAVIEAMNKKSCK